MSPKVILYIGFVIALFPLFAMYQYVSIIMVASVETHDPKVLKGLIENMAMLGMFSWPVWLGLAGFSVLRWKFFNPLERLLAWVPMISFMSCYYMVLSR